MHTQTRTQQIHSDFRNAINMSSVSIETVPEDGINSKDLLEELGFNNSSTYTKVATEFKTKTSKKQLNSIAIELFRMEVKYPKYRIISLSKVFELCRKYGLAVGKTHQYTNMIPDANLLEIREYLSKISVGDMDKYKTVIDLITDNRCGSSKNHMFIAAPPVFFEKDLTYCNGFMIDAPQIKMKKVTFSRMIEEATDPIVLQPLSLNISTKDVYCHIVTAWDVEANDDAVTRQIPVNSSLS